MSDTRALPIPDLDSKPYWAALAEGRLELQQCRDCAHWTWPPRPICSFCQGENLLWQAASGTGEVHSWVTVHNVYGPAFAELVPYITALVRIDEQDDILIPGRFLSEVELYQGLRVQALAERLTDEVGELNWKADTAGG
jgi:uncharacterized OB-fold protein